VLCRGIDLSLTARRKFVVLAATWMRLSSISRRNAAVDSAWLSINLSTFASRRSNSGE
jgi:hypothetical protein